jgi:heme exporter protein B
LKEVFILFKKELKLEFRNRQNIASVFLYILSTVFICFLSIKKIFDTPVWNALLWIILLFVSVNTVAKSFIHESKEKMIYYYSVCSPVSFLVSKLKYNMVFMFLISVFTFFIYSLLLGNIVQDYLLFFTSLILGISGFTAILTLMSAIASKTENGFAIVSVLSIPVIVPILVTAIKLSKNAIDGLALNYIISLAAIDIISIALSLILFPYLWKE